MSTTHEWVKSTLGHGDAMCARCFITNREAAVLGLLNNCPKAPEQQMNSTSSTDIEILYGIIKMAQDGLIEILDGGKTVRLSAKGIAKAKAEGITKAKAEGIT